MGDLEKVLPIPVTLEVAGVTLSLREVPIGRMPSLLRHLRPALDEWNRQGADFQYLRFVEAVGDEAVMALAIACDRTPEWVAGLTMEQSIELATAVIEVNQDFFAQLLREMPELMRGLTGGSPTYSPTSLPSVTDIPISWPSE